MNTVRIGSPKILIIGHGRSGKDTVAQILSNVTGLKWGGVSSYMCKMVAEKLGVPPDEAWENRHKNREKWRAIIDEHRKDDPACIVKEMLAEGYSIIAGLRPRAEFDAVKPMFNHTIWVERDVPSDPTLELTKEDATITIGNNSTLGELGRKVSALGQIMVPQFISGKT